MPLRRRVVLATDNVHKAAEIDRELKLYDIEVTTVAAAESESDSKVSALLRMRGDTYWHKAVFRESTEVFQVPHGGLDEFKQTVAAMQSGEPAADTPEMPPTSQLEDGEPVIVFSRLDVWMLSTSEEKLVREAKLTAQHGALHTHPRAVSAEVQGGSSGSAAEAPSTSAASEPEEQQLRHFVYTHQVEGFIDRSRQAASEDGVFGWDDVVVLLQTSGQTYHDLAQRGLKFSPRDVNVARWVMDHIHYKSRKATKFINAAALAFKETVSFEEQLSVRQFVASNEYFNNVVARSAGLRDVFVAVANNGAFFRAAHTRREVNYWLPGLNAGIPFVSKKDPIHEITFTAHDFCHFLIPDLVFTGNTSTNGRRAYIIYRMLSEACTMVFADMLFVETLRLSGYEYDWTKRKIWPLFKDCGVDPFDDSKAKDGDSPRQHFLRSVRKLLAANVAYCLGGDDSKYKALIAAHRGEDFLVDGTCPSLEDFKIKFMPFFVEDFKWTSANFENMARRADQYKHWWTLCQPIVEAAGLGDMQNGIGLETVDQHLAALGVSLTDEPQQGEAVPEPAELVNLIFTRVCETRLDPVLETPGEFQLAPPTECLKNSFARYLAGQVMLLARFDFVQPETDLYLDKITRFFAQHVGHLTEGHVAKIRGLFAQYCRVLLGKGLITPDDYDNYSQIFPLFDPVYVFYDEEKSFYQELAEVQAKILSPAL